MSTFWKRLSFLFAPVGFLPTGFSYALWGFGWNFGRSAKGNK